MMLLLLKLPMGQLYTDETDNDDNNDDDNNDNDDDANDNDNDTRRTNHDCIGSLACMSNEPKIQQLQLRNQNLTNSLHVTG